MEELNMKRTIILLGTLAALPIAVVIAGCSKSSSTPAKTENSTANADSAKNPTNGDSKEDAAKEAEITAALAKLDASDRSQALQQRVCPVSGEKLGTMGAPVKVDVKGQAVFICFEGCKDQLLEKPDEYLAKLNK